ncbi:MAG: hypothetical protein KatS3mg104_0112 [Phycisphaerae bacterium]|jgi:hypothetical protein|nr:MAG: hypothetical protein KatS3mg104_0112 [Phycisphaerae bacterium]
MIEKIRHAANTPAGKVTAGVLLLLALIMLIWSILSNFGSTEAASLTSARTFICTETGKVFTTSLREGWTVPVPSPYSGKNTGVPAEQCFWTKEGTLKSEPTYVLLNEYLGKSDPTFCPDCGRLVVQRNPIYRVGDPTARPPPTREEYARRKQNED